MTWMESRRSKGTSAVVAVRWKKFAETSRLRVWSRTSEMRRGHSGRFPNSTFSNFQISNGQARSGELSECEATGIRAGESARAVRASLRHSVGVRAAAARARDRPRADSVDRIPARAGAVLAGAWSGGHVAGTRRVGRHLHAP